MTDVNIVDRMYGALAAGDIASACDCYTDDAIIWHGFDRIEQSRDEAAKAWEDLAKTFAAQFATNVRRQPLAKGYVQQHEWHAQTADGKWMAWPICIVVEIRNGLIARLDEYIDRAGSFEPKADFHP